MSPRFPFLDHALLLLLAFIWGSSFTLIKVVVIDIPPLTLTWMRITTAALALGLAARLAGQAWPRGGRMWAWIVAAGLTGNIIPFSLISWGEQVIDSGLAAIYIAIVPIAVLVLAHFLTTDERITPAKGLGVAFGFAGILVLVGPRALAGMDEHLLRQLAVAAAAVSYAANTLIIKRISGQHPIAMAAAIMAVSALLLAPFALWRDFPIHPSALSLAGAALLGLVHTGLATLIMFAIVRRRGAGFFSMINFLIPLFGYFLGVALLGEPLRPRALAALGLILSGIWLSTRASGARRPAPTD